MVFRFRKKWPINVEIVENRQGNRVLSFDKAMRTETPGEGSIIALKKRKVKLPAIPLNYVSLDTRGRNYLKLFTPDNKKYYPIKLDAGAELSDARYIEEKEWDVVDHRLTMKIKDLFEEKSFFEQYKEIMYIALFGLVMIMMFYVTFKNLGDIMTVAKDAVQVAHDNLEVARQISQSLAQAKATATTIPPY
jgi:hypothetical protein